MPNPLGLLCRHVWARLPDHKYTEALRALVAEFENRRTRNIKDVRNIVVAELGSNKPPTA